MRRKCLLLRWRHSHAIHAHVHTESAATSAVWTLIDRWLAVDLWPVQSNRSDRFRDTFLTRSITFEPILDNHISVFNIFRSAKSIFGLIFLPYRLSRYWFLRICCRIYGVDIGKVHIMDKWGVSMSNCHWLQPKKLLVTTNQPRNCSPHASSPASVATDMASPIGLSFTLSLDNLHSILREFGTSSFSIPFVMSVASGTSDLWYFDSACYNHMTSNSDFFR